MNNPVVGIDLAGSKHRPTGLCVLDGAIAKTSVVHSDQEILKVIVKARPKVVSIDAPLSLPKGRHSINDRNGPHFRKCDLQLMTMRIRFFPITLGPMRMLTSRGMSLKRRLEKMGFKVIESFPGGAQDLLHIPRKQKGLDGLRKGLQKLGIKGIRKNATGDELDAITCAYVGKCYLENNFLALGDEKEGQIIMPRPLL